jgi:hypothetical protein
MSRLSQNQKRRRHELDEQMNHGLFPVQQNTLPANQNTFPISRYRPSETTKETCYSLPDKQEQDRMCQKKDRMWEGSPLEEAAPSQSSLTSEQPASTSKSKKEPSQKDLVSAVRLVFPARQRLYSVDVFGRRSEIDTRFLSGDGYLTLLDACKNPLRLNDVQSQVSEIIPVEPPSVTPEGCKIGPETELPLPEWWEVPEEGTAITDIEEMIRRNLERAKREGGGIFAKVPTFGFSRGLTIAREAR